MPALSQERIFKYLTALLGLVACGLLVKELFFRAEPLSIPDIGFPMPEINIDTEVFEEFKIEELSPFEKVTLPELVGRENPFEPYSLEEYRAALEALRAATTTEEIATSSEEVATTTGE